MYFHATVIATKLDTTDVDIVEMKNTGNEKN